MNDGTARTPLTGAVAGGLGMALTEEAVMDHRLGVSGTANLAEHHVPVNAHIPQLEAF
jgi:xanthine dehydrogenase YagR molybdenum-binding subunit